MGGLNPLRRYSAAPAWAGLLAPWGPGTCPPARGRYSGPWCRGLVLGAGEGGEHPGGGPLPPPVRVGQGGGGRPAPSRLAGETHAAVLRRMPWPLAALPCRRSRNRAAGRDGRPSMATRPPVGNIHAESREKSIERRWCGNPHPALYSTPRIFSQIGSGPVAESTRRSIHRCR